MAQFQSSSNRTLTGSSICKLLLWGVALFAALSITTLPGDWGHSVCGAWGCGPPTQALVGCHLAWLVLLAPLAIVGGSSSRSCVVSPQRLGRLLSLTGAALLVGVVIYQRATWLPMATQWQRQFFWQRCGFVVVTSIDIPMLQLLAVGLTLRWRGRDSAATSAETNSAPETEHSGLASPDCN